MNFAHIHLVLTHFPPVLTLFGAISAVSGLLMRQHRRELARLTRLSMILASVLTPMTYFAGGRAADKIALVDGINQEAIAPHQSAASIALIASIAAGLVAAAAALVDRRSHHVPVVLEVILIVAAITSAVVIGWTAALGGAIHHPEIGL
jgi:hypothetical protein